MSERNQVGEQVVFAAAVADGAGSAQQSAEGARLVCDQFMVELEEALVGLPQVIDEDERAVRPQPAQP